MKKVSSEGTYSLRGFYPVIFFFLTVATRIPFCSSLLYHFDSVNFALALERYDVTVHQPHPPGYFLYVMLGRVAYLLTKDANSALVLLSIVFTSLTVAVLYLLGEAIYDRKSGIVAGCLALTSPNLWFHGEIALSYGVESFFSAVIGLLCWKVSSGRYSCIWPSAILLGLAGGIRQNTVVFLLPLFLFAVRKAPLWKIAAALLLMGTICIAWLVPMVLMTGGWPAYAGAFAELWRYSSGHNSVFDRGWEAFSLYSQSLYNFTVFSCGAGIVAMGLAAYTCFRHRLGLDSLPNLLFFTVWALPSVLFYLVIYVHPKNPGYALIFTPPLLLVSAHATAVVGDHLQSARGRAATFWLTSLLALLNTGVFLFSSYPVSWRTIRNNDRIIATVVTELQSFDPSTTAFCVPSHLFCGFRQIMYYLPQYSVYKMETGTSPPGEKRQIFWGVGRQTFLSKEIELPSHVSNIATVLADEDRNLAAGLPGITTLALLPEISVAYGSIDALRQIYPEMTALVQRKPGKQ